MSYDDRNDVREHREYIYVSANEKDLIKRWAKMRRKQRATALYEYVIEKVKQDLKRLEMNEFIASSVHKDLDRLG